MYLNFNSVFKAKKSTEHSIPPALLDYFNRELPNGLKYVIDKEGNCILENESESMRISGIKFAPTDEQKKILGEKYSVNDVLKYCENSQQPIPIVLEKEKYITINDKEIAISKLKFNPFIPLKYEVGNIFMNPKKFKIPFPVKLGCSGYEKTLMIKRVPNNSVSVASFESEKDEVLQINYLIDTSQKRITINMSIYTINARTIRDIVISSYIYNAFVDGKGFINGHSINVQIDATKTKKINANTIFFWEKILKIEDALGISFIPPHENIDLEDELTVEMLYQNLIKHRPVRDTNQVDSIDTNWDLKNPNENLDDLINKAISFQFEATYAYELFGVKFKLPVLVGIFNSVIKEHLNTKEGKQKLILVDEGETKKRYMSLICFKTEGEMKAYKDLEANKVLESLHNAKKAQEYLNEK